MSPFSHKSAQGEMIEDAPRNDVEEAEKQLIEVLEHAIQGNIQAEIALGNLIAHYHARLEADHYAQRAIAADSSKESP